MDAALAIISRTTPHALVDEVTRRAVQLTGARAGVVRLREGSWASGIEARAGDLSGPRPDLVVPLRGRDGDKVGEIGVDAPGDKPHSPEAEQLLIQVAAFASTALENMRLYHAMAEAQAQREAFFGILSHELRTPITTIYGGTKMLVGADGRLSHDARREIQADIAADAERLYRLIEDLLVLTRSEHGSLQIAAEPVLLQRLLPRVVDSERSRWPTVDFRVDLPPGLPPVAGEETYVEQVARNLLSNAGKYGGTHGRVTLAVTVRNWVEIRVLDEGPGLGDEDPESLFELFYRSETAVRRASGAGIGLYACRELVTAMGGRIWGRSRPGGGAEFGFALPVFAEEVQPDGAAPG
jgi:K+-sensing histidine kinase KdpD